MDSLSLYIATGATAVVAATILGLIGLRAFTAWIDLKRAELERPMSGTAPVGHRIDVADLKERVRRLEAIAAGVEF